MWPSTPPCGANTAHASSGPTTCIQTTVGATPSRSLSAFSPATYSSILRATAPAYAHGSTPSPALKWHSAEAASSAKPNHASRSAATALPTHASPQHSPTPSIAPATPKRKSRLSAQPAPLICACYTTIRIFPLWSHRSSALVSITKMLLTSPFRQRTTTTTLGSTPPSRPSRAPLPSGYTRHASPPICSGAGFISTCSTSSSTAPTLHKCPYHGLPPRTRSIPTSCSSRTC